MFRRSGSLPARAVFAAALAPLLAVLALSGPTTAAAQSSTEYQGAVATGLALRRLGTTARVLHIGAHPDDENTALFAPIALGKGADAAYLSLTRGEGGQNGIGPELGVALGLIRSEELLAARRLDGGTQFFSRAIDYGYSKNADEAFRHWPRDSLLADVVAVIRRYRPDVVVSVWSGTPRDGHGQHQASGILAREAVLAAGDPSRFPEQIAAGLRPFTPKLYYRSAWFSAGPPDVELNTGRLDPLLGRSYHQVAMAARSRHRSQDQGVAQAPGPRRTGFDRVDPSAAVRVAASRRGGRYQDGAPAGDDHSLFEGVDTLLSQRAARVAATATGDARRSLTRAVQLFGDYEQRVRAAREAFDALAPWELLPALTAAQGRLEQAAGALHAAAAEDGLADAVREVEFHVDGERADLRTALLDAANVELDAVTSEENVVPGQTFRLELSLWNGGPGAVRATARPSLPRGWAAEPVDGTAELAAAPGQRATVTYAVTVPGDAPPTMPYYLHPGTDPSDLYRWPDNYSVRGLPFAAGPVHAAFRVTLDGADPVAADREAAFVAVDRRSGEHRHPVKVVPAVALDLEPALAVVPLDHADRPLDFAVRLRAQADRPVTGRLRLRLPDGWSATPDRSEIRLEGAGAEETVAFQLTPPAGVEAGEYAVGAALEAGGRTYTLGYDVVDYPHIAPHHLYHTATARVRALDVKVADVRVGYVAGAGDGVPEALDQLGVPWTALDEDALAQGDLDRFDVIITGIRAYEVRPDLVAHNPRLLDWVRRGGTLVVQYNKYPALQGSYAPWPVTIARPHGRVTDETAPVTVLAPDNPILTTPNRIGPADWEGWVQERGLYFWDSWDGPLTPLLSMHDPGEAPLTGSLLVAPLGKGTYVYTALALFRQLPAGVPGAYRLLANLVSLGAQ